MADLTEHPVPAAVRLLDRTPDDLLAVIDYHGGATVLVRRRPGLTPWRCEACGPQTGPACVHARAVALTVQAHHLLTAPAAGTIP